VIARLADVDRLAHVPVALVVVHGCHRPIDRDLVEIGPAEANELGVGVREQAPLKEWIIGEIDARDEVPRVKGDLFRLREEVVGVSVEHEAADPLDRHELLGDQLRRIQQVELEGVLVLFLDDLQAELPLGKAPLSIASHRSRR
jgi:hypothetical protein